jgi:hypothetical protein
MGIDGVVTVDTNLMTSMLSELKYRSTWKWHLYDQERRRHVLPSIRTCDADTFQLKVIARFSDNISQQFSHQTSSERRTETISSSIIITFAREITTNYVYIACINAIPTPPGVWFVLQPYMSNAILALAALTALTAKSPSPAAAHAAACAAAYAAALALPRLHLHLHAPQQH